MMRSFLFVFILGCLLASCDMQHPTTYSGDLKIGNVVEGELEFESPDTFNLHVDAETFLFGQVNQLTVDVAVSIYD